MKKRRRKIGLPPGTFLYTGHKTDLPILVNYLAFDPDRFIEERYEQDKPIPIHQSVESLVQWYDIRGLHDEGLIRKISEAFGVHPLAMEDAVDVFKRPEYAEYEQGHFCSLKALAYQSDNKELIHQNVGVYFGKGFVLTFQESEDDLFADIRQRLQQGKGRIRLRGADYLAYSIVDFLVDRYYYVTDGLEEEVEAIEEMINEEPESVDKAAIFEAKKNLIRVRRYIAPLREALNQLARTESELIDERTTHFVRDVYDHVIQILDSIDAQREVINGLQDLYLSELSMKMNRVMQFLTIITALFVPISFLAGLYGMNFANMPELANPNGYYNLLAVMAVIVVGMLLVFWRKKWF